MLDQVSEVAIEEIDQINFAITRQLLKVHTLEYEHGRPKIAKIELHPNLGRAIVHFQIKGERIFFTVFLDTEPKVKVVWTNITEGSRVIFKVTSETIRLDKISSLTKIPPTCSWDIGAPHPNGHGKHTFSLFGFEPITEMAGDVESKINTLLDKLEQDREGIRKMSAMANSYIQIHWHGYYGNGMLGGFQLNKVTISRLANLQLAIDFDLYADGNPFE
jgi:hypothetical protein